MKRNLMSKGSIAGVQIPCENRDDGQQVKLLIQNLASIKGSYILLVEDNLFNKEIAIRLLTNAGFKVDVAENGHKSIEMLDKRAYDIVLMDMQMPVMDGATATLEIRKDVRFKDLPIVAMTADVMEEDIEKCLEAGMWDHIGKPIDIVELFGKLLKWVKPRYIEEIQETTRMPSIEVEKEEPKLAKQEYLPDIPGLDTRLGLKRVMGNKTFYLDMLKKHIDNQKQISAQIRLSLDSGDYVTAERLAHTVKGVSGNIGASKLQELAAALEKAIRDGLPREEIGARFEIFAAVHGKLIASLMEAFPAVVVRKEVGKVDELKSAAVCEKMMELLANGDSEALDYIETENDILCYIMGEEYFGAFEYAVKQYDFEKALELMNPQAKRFNEQM
jgi:two-component system, sensor histidine kinase and response regulator